MPCRSDYDYCHVVQGSPTLLLRDSACFAKSLSFKAHRKGETFPLDALAVLNVCNTKVLFQTSSVCVCACVRVCSTITVRTAQVSSNSHCKAMASP